MSTRRPSDPRGRQRPRPWAALLLVAGLAGGLSACDGWGRGTTASPPDDVEIGDVASGRELFVGYGCGACHQLDDLRQARGRVGPALDDLAEQRMLAGSVPNTPEMLAAWIRDPQAYAENTGMPDVGVTVEDSHDIAAFLLQAD